MTAIKCPLGYIHRNTSKQKNILSYNPACRHYTTQIFYSRVPYYKFSVIISHTYYHTNSSTKKNNNHTYQTFNIKNTFIKTHILDEPKTYTKLNIILPTFSLPFADKYCISLSENFPSYISNLHHININTTTI